jgi:hypothetical protein
MFHFGSGWQPLAGAGRSYARTGAEWRIAERRHEQLWESTSPARQFPAGL